MLLTISGCDPGVGLFYLPAVAMRLPRVSERGMARSCPVVVYGAWFLTAPGRLGSDQPPVDRVAPLPLRVARERGESGRGRSDRWRPVCGIAAMGLRHPLTIWSGSAIAGLVAGFGLIALPGRREPTLAAAPRSFSVCPDRHGRKIWHALGRRPSLKRLAPVSWRWLLISLRRTAPIGGRNVPHPPSSNSPSPHPPPPPPSRSTWPRLDPETRPSFVALRQGSFQRLWRRINDRVARVRLSTCSSSSRLSAGVAQVFIVPPLQVLTRGIIGSGRGR